MTVAKPAGILRTIPLLTIMCLVTLPAQAQYSGGSGTADDPYQIATAADLIALGETPGDYDKHFILTADIDLDPSLPGRKLFDGAVIAPDLDADWSFEGTPFSGVLDGNGHVISHLTITGRYHLGLVGWTAPGAVIRDLGLESVSINSAGGRVGGLVGNNDGIIIGCYSIGTCYSFGTHLFRDDYIGGLVGINAGSITASYSSGVVKRSSHAGSCAGGLVGSNHGSITASFSSASVSGFYRVGGLVGCSDGWITASYGTGAVDGESFVGGLVGGNGGAITASYSTGTVTGNGDVGGLVGDDWPGGSTASYWDVETSGQATSAGGAGLTTAQMQSVDTFLDAGWDFVGETLNGTCDYWQISPSDYPQLQCHVAAGPVMPEGAGTAAEPYLIREARDLGTVWFEPLARYRLEASVDLSGITWSTAVVPWFGGTFDGSGYVISHLCIHGAGHLGMFGGSTGEILHLGLEAVDINGTGDYVGALVGSNAGSITSSYSTGTTIGDSSAGGLVGSNTGNITTSYSSASVSGFWEVGGLVGFSGGWITASYGTGAVDGESSVGGLVGRNDGAITNCHRSGTVTGDRAVGGLVGYNRYHGSITSSQNSGTVSGQGGSDPWGGVGGLVGSNWGDVTASHSTGTVTGETQVGGLVGLNYAGDIQTSYSAGVVSASSWVGGLVGVNTGEDEYSSSHIARCKSTASVSGDSAIGGLVGSNENGIVTDSYATGSVTGGQQVGGLVACHGSAGLGATLCVTRCYSTGLVTGEAQSGGLVGPRPSYPRWRPGEVLASFWDMQTSGQTDSDGGIGHTTAEMQTATTFLEAGWDFAGETENGVADTWTIIQAETYPLLSWEKYGGGTGEPNDPYLIYTAEHLNAVGAEPNDYDKHFKLMADIDLSGYVYDRAVIAADINDTEEGFQGIGFRGHFHGNGHTISHLTIRGNSNLGLFGYLGTWNLGSGTMVSTLGLDSIDVNGTGSCIGGLAGSSGFADIAMSYSTGAVSGDTNVGGLVGSYTAGDITGCHSSATVNGSGYYVGGLVGGYTAGVDNRLTSCHTSGTVSGECGVGGLLGLTHGHFLLLIAECSSSSTVIGGRAVGGLVGSNTFEMGPDGAALANCCSSGVVTGHSMVGGLIGQNWERVATSYSTASVSGYEFVGGLVGYYGRGEIIASYSAGAVGGTSYVGGLVGFCSGTGINEAPADIISSFWDMETSGTTTGYHINEDFPYAATRDVESLTTAEMQSASTFFEAGWDFIDETENGTDDIWWILEGQDYPRLWWEGGEEAIP